MSTVRQHVTALALAATTALTALALTSPSAGADPGADGPAAARAAATALRQELDRLTLEQSLAGERYLLAQSELQQAVTDELLARAAADDATRRTAGVRSLAARRGRALYMSGGRLGLTATVLESRSIGDALSRLRAVEEVVGGDDLDLPSYRAGAAVAAGDADALAKARVRTQALRVSSAQALVAVQESVAARTRALDAADAEVRRLEAEERAQLEAQALARAAESARLAGIRDAAAGPDPRTTALGDDPGTGGPVAQAAVRAALSRLGSPYVWGATGPSTFDCSGLTMWAWRQAGVQIPRTSRQQYAGLTHVPLSAMLPGDLVFYATDTSDPGSIHHVGMYLGGGRTVYAPQTGGVVKIGSVTYDRIIGVARPGL